MPVLRPLRTSAPVNRHTESSLEMEALRHPAVHHRWLQRIESNEFVDMISATQDFAWALHTMMSWYPRFLEAVHDRISGEHRETLQRRILSESGKLDVDERIDLTELGFETTELEGTAKVQILERFCLAMGLQHSDLAIAHPIGLRWRTRLLHYLQTSTPAEAFGALAFGLEAVSVVTSMRVLSGLHLWRRVARHSLLYFELRCRVDEIYQKGLHEIARQFRYEGGDKEMRAGMLSALRMQEEAWDLLFEDSQNRTPPARA